jgi:hypothetical protein
MAFLDRSGDIIVDAVLTDIGREKLARNDGSFKIVGYTFADDEIDYSLFNPATGSAFMDEEILETPLFEANVNEKVNLNFPMMIITNPNLKYLPTLAADTAAITIGEEKGLSAGVTVRFYQSTDQNAKTVPSEIQDSGFKVELLNELLQIENESPVDITPYGTAIYVIQRDAQLIQSSQGSQVTFKLRPQSLSDSTWTKLGVSASFGAKRTIATKAKAVGLNSGLSSTITITIQEEFNRQ